MTRILLLFLLLLSCGYSYGQQTIAVDVFSADYSAEIYVADPDQTVNSGWVAIYAKKSNKQLLKMDYQGLRLRLPASEASAAKSELSDSLRGIILHQDFNFDGKKDFALLERDGEPLFGAAYQIYLATANGFDYSEEFTELSRESNNLFVVNKDSKTISALRYINGGQAQQRSQYRVKNNKLELIDFIEEGPGEGGICRSYYREQLVKGKWIKTYRKTLSEAVTAENIVFYAELNNQQRLRLVNLDNQILTYILTDKQDVVELVYTGVLHYSSAENKLWFDSEKKTTYAISEDGITITALMKTTKIAAVKTRKIGNLADILHYKFDNLQLE